MIVELDPRADDQLWIQVPHPNGDVTCIFVQAVGHEMSRTTSVQVRFQKQASREVRYSGSGDDAHVLTEVERE